MSERTGSTHGSNQGHHVHPSRRWLGPIAVVTVLGAAGIAAIGGSKEDSSASSSPPSATDPPIVGSLPGPVTVAETVPSVVVTEPPTPKTHLSETINPGMASNEIVMVQTRLKELGFDPGKIDGGFYTSARQAVWAFEALTTGKRYDELKGVVTDDMWQLMQDDLEFKPRRETGVGTTHMEIYLPQQAAIVFKDDKAILITHISSGQLDDNGQPKRWHETVTIDVDENGQSLDEPITKAVTALSYTPGGVFEFSWRYPGKRMGPLGGMWNPVYFNGGIAVHGADKVPVKPASHGCIRIPNHIADYFPSLVKRHDKVFVWGQDGREPEDYSAREREPSVNEDDPDATVPTT